VDCTDAATVGADPDGKRPHVVEGFDAVAVGTSILIAAAARADCTMATAIEPAAAIVTEQGWPHRVTIDRAPRFVGETAQRASPSALVRCWLCLGGEVHSCPPRRPDLHGFVERSHRSSAEDCLQVARPTALELVRTVTATFKQQYNQERPHQGLACGNQPPRSAFPVAPSRPLVPTTVDADRWISALDGQRYVRTVQQETRVTLGTGRDEVTQALRGQAVTLHVDAPDRTLVVKHAGVEVKRAPIQGTGRGRMPFAAFVEVRGTEARTGRGAAAAQLRPLVMPL